MAAIRALGGRGDTSAIPALESLLTSKDLSIEMVPAIKQQIARLKNGGKMPGDDTQERGEATSAGGTPASSTDVRLERLEKLVQEMIGRLKTIESRLPAPKAPSAAQTPGASQGQN
jgi:HEAT repeat protein